MSAPEELMDLYVDELMDLWSANDQMGRVLGKLSPSISDDKLAKMMKKSKQGIEEHTEMLKQLLEDNDENVSKEHCKGMEGLVNEASKHLIDEAPEKGPVFDALLIAQYQRMSHYGIAGFGTAAAYAKALGLDDDVKLLDQATKDIYDSDEYGTKLAETSINIEAMAD